MREWVGDRVVKDLSAFKYSILNRNYEVTIGVSRNKVTDDQVGIYLPRIRTLAEGAVWHRDQLVFGALAAAWTELCADGQFMIDTDHSVAGASVSNHGGGASTAWYLMDTKRSIKPLILQVRKQPELVALDKSDSPAVFTRNEYQYGVDDRKAVGYGLWQLLYGSKQTLNSTNYAAARAAMMAFTKDDGKTPLGITPDLLVVPPTLEASGRALVESQFDAAGGSNVWYKTAELLVCPWLA
jgi:phage major head subunit gpT-like protein